MAKLHNTTTGTLTISDMPGAESGTGLVIQAGATATVFNEDLEKSAQAQSLIDGGLLDRVSDEEPSSGTSVDEASKTYDYGTVGHSYQALAVDLKLEPAVGSADGANPKYLATAMFNTHNNDAGAPLTKGANYLAGVIGAYSITGTKATSYPSGAVLAQVTDGVTAVDGAVVAYIDGDSSVTLANAAFKAMQNNSQAGSGFNFGLDLFGAAHDGFLELSIKKADIRMSHEVCVLSGAGAPTDGVTGAGYAEIGSLYINRTSGKGYFNGGTKATPAWKIITSA